MTTFSEPITLVLLVHNEAEIIEKVIRDFYGKIVKKIPGSEILVAEDGSTDGTKEILDRLKREIPELRLEQGKERRGYANAFKTAMTLPKTDLILFCDSSGKYDPDDFWSMAPKMSTHDMVIGYKEHRKDPLYRIALTKVFNLFVNSYFGVSFHDIDCPLRLFKKSAFLDVSSDTWIQRDLISFEVTLRFVYKGYHVTEVPIKHFSRSNGPSRGLPANKIPGVIWRTLRNFPKIKNELKQFAAYQRKYKHSHGHT